MRPSVIKPADALKLSVWLAATDPKLFRAITRHISALQRSNPRALGLFGDDIVVSAPDPSGSSVIDSTGWTPDLSAPVVSDPNIDTAALASIDSSTTDLSTLSAPTIDTSLASSSQSGPSFWSSLGSGVQSIAGAVGGVAAALTQPQVLSSVAGAVKTYYQTQAQTAATQAQTQIATMQMNRVLSGYSPAPVTYQRNPVTGQLTPVYASNSGLSTVTGHLYNQLLYPSTMGINPSLLLIGGAAVVWIALATKR